MLKISQPHEIIQFSVYILQRGRRYIKFHIIKCSPRKVGAPENFRKLLPLWKVEVTFVRGNRRAEHGTLMNLSRLEENYNDVMVEKRNGD